MAIDCSRCLSGKKQMTGACALKGCAHITFIFACAASDHFPESLCATWRSVKYKLTSTLHIHMMLYITILCICAAVKGDRVKTCC